MANTLDDIRLVELNDSIIQLNKVISSLQKTIDENTKTIAEKDAIIANLTAQLDYLKNKLFGSTSEKRKDDIPGQLDLTNEFYGIENEDEKFATIEPEYIEVKAHTKKKKKPKATYEEMFANIPTTDIPINTLTDEEKICSKCGLEMVPIGTEVVRTEIIYTEPKLERINYVATTYACPKCKEDSGHSIVKDDVAPPALISGSYMSESLMSHIMDQKYSLSLPLCRLEGEFERLGVKMPRTTMASDIIKCSMEYLDPVCDFLHRKMLKRRYLMADETTLQVLKEKDRRPQTKSYIWVLRTGEDDDVPIIYYRYTPTRAGKNAADLLKGAEPGYFLMTDGYQGYNLVPEAQRCCCYAHIRRKWKQAIPKGHEKDYNDPAVQGFMYCNKLFEYERQYMEKGLSIKQRYNRRLKDEKPVIEAFLAWVDKLHPKTGDAIIRAITYTNNCRPYMMNYLKDGACSLHNNLSEQAVKTVVIGRKNWLFSESTDGADAGMDVFTIIATAKANGLDSKKYLEYILIKRPNKKMTDEEFEMIAPWSDEAREICGK